MEPKQYLKILLIEMLLISIIPIQVYADTTAIPINATEREVVTLLLQNPKTLIAMLIQFFLGFALGYVSVKIVKYVIAFIGVIMLGSVLSVWSLGGSIEDLLVNTNQYTQQLLPLVKGLLITLGIFTVGPLSAGFIVGLIIGLIKK